MLEPYGPYRFRLLGDGADDHEFVRRLFHATLRAQMAWHLTGLGDAQIALLLDQQLAAQTAHYRTNFPQAEVSIVEHPAERVARLIVIESFDEVVLGDLMVVPEHRRRGLCSYIMDRYVERGLASGRPIRLHVEKTNAAMDLYRRKSFEIVEDLQSHWLMEYRSDRDEHRHDRNATDRHADHELPPVDRLADRLGPGPR